MDPATYGEGNHGSQIMPKAHGRLGYGSNQREDGADVVGTSNNYDRPISLIHQRNLDMEPVNWEPNSSIFESPQKKCC